MVRTVPNPSSVGPAMVTSTFTYDGPGRMATSTSRLYSDDTNFTEVTTTYVRDDPSHPGDVTAVIDPEGNETSFVFDPDTGYLLSVTDPTGAVSSFEYDDLGRQVASIAPHGHLPGADPADWTTTSTFNEWGRPLVLWFVVYPVGAFWLNALFLTRIWRRP